jgi:hypothetical protein
MNCPFGECCGGYRTGFTVDLDSDQLNEASSVQRFRFKDVEVQLNELESKMEIVKGEFVKVVDYEELRRKPSGVFREVLKVIGE